MKQEFSFPFYVVYQAFMRKFTLAGKTMAFGEMTRTVCEILIFVDSITMPVCTEINAILLQVLRLDISDLYDCAS